MKKIIVLNLLIVSYSLFAARFTVNEGLTKSLSWATDVAKTTDCVITNDGFRKEVLSHVQFDFTNLTSVQVHSSIVNSKSGVVISSYRTKSPWSKTIAFRNVGSNIVYFNTRRNPRPKKEMVNTLVHEWLHTLGFGHGDNRAAGKGNSVPYGIGKMAEKYVEVCDG